MVFGDSGLGPGFLLLHSRTGSGLGVVGPSGIDVALPRPSGQRAEPRDGTFGRLGDCFGDWWPWLSDAARLALEAQLDMVLLMASSVGRSDDGRDLWSPLPVECFPKRPDFWSPLPVEGLPKRLRSLSPMAAKTGGWSVFSANCQRGGMAAESSGRRSLPEFTGYLGRKNLVIEKAPRDMYGRSQTRWGLVDRGETGTRRSDRFRKREGNTGGFRYRIQGVD